MHKPVMGLYDMNMSPKDNAMTRYWQYYVGQTIREHCAAYCACEVDVTGMPR